MTADLNWFATYGPLSEHFNVVALDHRGHGRGLRSRRPFRLEDCADDAAGVVRELGLERVVAAGYSMGGPVAQLLWRRHRDLVAGLVLCATAPTFSSPDLGSRVYFSSLLGLSLAARLTPAPVRRHLSDRVVRRRLADWPLAEWGMSELGRNDTTAVLEAGWALGRFDARPWLAEVDVPASVVVTTRDQVVNPGRQHALAAGMPGAEVVEVDADHSSPVTDPGRFTPALVGACLSVASRAGLGTAPLSNWST